MHFDDWHTENHGWLEATDPDRFLGYVLTAYDGAKAAQGRYRNLFGGASAMNRARCQAVYAAAKRNAATNGRGLDHELAALVAHLDIDGAVIGPDFDADRADEAQQAACDPLGRAARALLERLLCPRKRQTCEYLLLERLGLPAGERPADLRPKVHARCVRAVARALTDDNVVSVATVAVPF